MKFSSLSPSKEKYINKQSESDIFDSDVTFVTDTQEKMHKQKQHNHSNKNEDSQNITQEASQSLLKQRKKKNRKVDVQSHSMLSEINGHMDSLPIDDSDNFSNSESSKKTKRKNSGLSEEFVAKNEPPIKKKKKESIDFFSQDFVNSTPKTEKKKKKKKLNIYRDYGQQDNTTPFKKEKAFNSSILSQSGSFLTLDESDNNSFKSFDSNQTFSQLHTSVEIVDNKNFDQFEESEIILPLKKRKKRKKRDVEADESKSLNGSRLNQDDSKEGTQLLDNGHPINNGAKKHINGFVSNESTPQTKKKKHKDYLNESINTLLDDYLADKKESFSNSKEKSSLTSHSSNNLCVIDYTDSDSSGGKRASKINGLNDSKISEDSSFTIKKKKKKKPVNQTNKLNGQHSNPLTLLDKYLDINLLDEADHSSDAVTADNNTNQRSSDVLNGCVVNEQDLETDTKQHKKRKKSKVPVDIKIEDLNVERISVVEQNSNQELSNVKKTSRESSLSVSDKEEHRKKKRRSKESVSGKKDEQVSATINDEKPKNKQKLSHSKSPSSDAQIVSDSGISDSDLKLEKGKRKNGELSSKSFITKNNTDSKNSSSSTNGSSNGNDAHFGSSDDSDNENVDPEKLKLHELKSTLKTLHIDVDFTVPELHNICNRASKPTPQQRDRIVEQKIPHKLGKFTKAEDKQIRENWNNFIKLYNFPDRPEVFFSLDKKYISCEAKKNFLFLLAQNLNDRTPYSVFLRFKILMRQTKQGRFTKEEDEYIMKTLKEGCERNTFTEIAEHLQRSFWSVEKRIKRLQEQHNRKIRWKNNNMAAFVKYMLKATGTSQNEIEKLKNQHISSTEWRRLSKKLDKVPIRILKRAWLVKIHPALFIPNDSCDLREVKIKLINMFYENKEHEWRAVNWSKYRSYFDGLTNLRIYSLMKNLVQSKVPERKRSNLRKCIKHLRKCVDLLPKHVIYKVGYKDGEIFDIGMKR